MAFLFFFAMIIDQNFNWFWFHAGELQYEVYSHADAPNLACSEMLRVRVAGYRQIRFFKVHSPGSRCLSHVRQGSRFWLDSLTKFSWVFAKIFRSAFLKALLLDGCRGLHNFPVGFQIFAFRPSLGSWWYLIFPVLHQPFLTTSVRLATVDPFPGFLQLMLSGWTSFTFISAKMM